MKLGIMGVGFGKGVRIDEDLIRHAESLGFDSARRGRSASAWKPGRTPARSVTWTPC